MYIVIDQYNIEACEKCNKVGLHLLSAPPNIFTKRYYPERLTGAIRAHLLIFPESTIQTSTLLVTPNR